MNEKRPGKEVFLKVYLIIALVIGIIGLTDGLLSFLNLNLIIYAFILSLISLIFFIFNIFALFHFIHERLEKITFVLPIYHIITYICFFSLGITLSIMNLFSNWVVILLKIIVILTASFEILFSLYLLKKFKFF